jgi:hypothetical protein
MLEVIPNDDAYHMPPVRVIHARVQSDTPVWSEEKRRFVSPFGDDLTSQYIGAMDTVNTASVEGALMYIQAEGININGRSREDRCRRKNKMNKIVFYEIIFVQTNETIAQFQDEWNVPEYGPMLAMDNGACSLEGDQLPIGCKQFNGEENQPQVGPFIGGGSKDDPRAPYPGTFWFSFPNTCPTKPWNKKTSGCREKTRQGLCDLGKLPDGITCTFTYDILGWIPIDDLVGISLIEKPDAPGQTFQNFTEWCHADLSHVEFAGDIVTGEMENGLDFWKDPKDETANEKRTQTMLEKYQELVQGRLVSSQVTPEHLLHFKPLPTAQELTEENPQCFYSVKQCGKGDGCKRISLSQICTKCRDEDAGKCKTSENGFKFPVLAKAPTLLSEEETKSNMDPSNAKDKKRSKDKKMSGTSTLVAGGWMHLHVVVVLIRSFLLYAPF